MIPAGHMRDEIVVLRKSGSRDALGGSTGTWSQLGQTRGRFLPFDARTQFVHGQNDILDVGQMWVDAGVMDVGINDRLQVEDGRIFMVNSMTRIGRFLLFGVQKAKD